MVFGLFAILAKFALAPKQHAFKSRGGRGARSQMNVKPLVSLNCRIINEFQESVRRGCDREILGVAVLFEGYAAFGIRKATTRRLRSVLASWREIQFLEAVHQTKLLHKILFGNRCEGKRSCPSLVACVGNPDFGGMLCDHCFLVRQVTEI